MRTTDADHALDGVGRAQGAGESRGYAQAQHGQRLGQTLAQAGRGAGMSLVQLGGQGAQLGLGGQRGVGVVGPPHPGRDDRAELVG